MPELPEVETMRRGLLPTVGGTITAISEPIIPYRPIKIEPTLKQFRNRAVVQLFFRSIELQNEFWSD